MTFADQLKSIMQRLNLDEYQASLYFGVPVYTLKKWVTGERKPSSATIRLLEILGIVEALAPELHQHLMPAQTTTLRKRGRPAKTSIDK